MADLVYPDLEELKRSHQPLTQGEWQVLDVLRTNLGGGWEIYVQPHLNGLKPDFVLLNPKIGVAVYEVKDWDTNGTKYRVNVKNGEKTLEATTSQGLRFTVSYAQNPFTKIKAYRRRMHELYMPSLGIQGSESLKNITAGVIFTKSARSQVLDLARRFRLSGEQPETFPIAGADTLANGDMRTILPIIDGEEWERDGQEACRDPRGWLRAPFLSTVQNTPLELNAKQRELSERPPASQDAKTALARSCRVREVSGRM